MGVHAIHMGNKSAREEMLIRDGKANPKKRYPYILSEKTKDTCVGASKRNHGNLTIMDEDRAETFLSFIRSVYRQLKPEGPM